MLRFFGLNGIKLHKKCKRLFSELIGDGKMIKIVI